MVLRLDPRYPIVWRSPDCLQVGVDSPLLVLDRLTVAQEKTVAALRSGINRSGLDMIARTAGGDQADVDRVLAALAPALLPPSGPFTPSITVHGTGPIAELLGRMLFEHLGGSKLVIVVASFVIAPELHSRWLRDDIPHLPVVAGDGAVRIGPIIEPGSGPCLYCLELHRTDADPAWPAIAAQLLDRPSPAESPLVTSEVAGLVARLALARLEGASDGTSAPGPAVGIELDLVTGERVERLWERHPDCQCAALDSAGVSPVRPGIATVSALPTGLHPISPTTGAGASVHG